MFNDEKGFTLVEIVASIVIITIVLLSFFQFFIQNNKVANSNTEKLVVVNLSHYYLDRLKLERNLSDPIDTKQHIHTMNNRPYTITVDTSQSTHEIEMKLVNVVVTVTSENGTTKGVAEGYVPYD